MSEKNLNEDSDTKIREAVDVPAERCFMWLRTFTAFTLRLFLRMPLILLASVFWGIAKLFETAGDGFNSAQTILKPITSAPFIYDWKKQLDDMEEDRRYRMLKKLKGELDT